VFACFCPCVDAKNYGFYFKRSWVTRKYNTGWFVKQQSTFFVETWCLFCLYFLMRVFK
jgi:hypothetical protein